MLENRSQEAVLNHSVNDTILSTSSCYSGSDNQNKSPNSIILLDNENNNNKEKDECTFFINYEKKKDEKLNSNSYLNTTGYYYNDGKSTQTTEVNSNKAKSINTLFSKHNINGNSSDGESYLSDSSSKKMKKYKNEHLKENIWFIKLLGMLTAAVYLIVLYTVWIKK